MIGAILFDIDGTLIDSNDLHAAAWREAFLHFGADIAFDAVRRQIGKGADNLMPALLPKELAERRGKEIEDYRSSLFKRDYLARAKPFDGVRPLFERLRREGKRIVLASSAEGEEVEHHLDLLGVQDLVAATTSADDAEHSKPDPDIFAAALTKVKPLGPEQVLVVGDSPYDMLAAGKLGIRSIGVRCGGFADSVLTDAGAAELFDGPADLLRNYEASLLGR